MEIMPDLNERIADTYRGGWDWCETYYKVKGAPEIPGKQLGESLGISESTVRMWRAGKSIPCAVQLIERLGQKEVLPLTADNRYLPLLNVWAAWVWASGYIDKKYVPSFSEKRSVIERLALEDKLRRICETTNTLQLYEASKGFAVLGDSLLGRILYALGCPRGEKLQNLYGLPGYLRNVGTEIQLDFVRMLVALRGRRDIRRYESGNRSTNPQIVITLPAVSSAGRARELAREAGRLVRSATEIAPAYSKPRKEANGYSGFIHIHSEQVHRLLKMLDCKGNDLKGLLHQVLEKSAKHLEK